MTAMLAHSAQTSGGADPPRDTRRLIYFQISDYSGDMPRRKPGNLLELEVSILAGLRDGGPRGLHGFALAQAIADDDESRRLTATGTLYRALHRLNDAGLIDDWWEDPNEAADAGRPRRRLYRITGDGAAALARSQAESDSSALTRLDPGYLS